MPRTALVLLAILLWGSAPSLTFAQDEPDPRKEFEELAERRDEEAVVALWKRHPAQVLYIIDSYLEGSLKLFEASDAPDMDRIRRMHDRALWGAKQADRAFGRPIFGEYASSFVGWNAEQKRRFREGQQSFGQARKALKSRNFAEALDHGRECLSRAQPLGDWWGTAMGLTAIGQAEEGLGNLERALTAQTAARMIYHDLGLVASEYRSALALASILSKLERYPRALVTVEQGLELAATLGDDAGTLRLLRIRLSVEEALGKTGTVAATKKRIAELEAKAEK